MRAGGTREQSLRNLALRTGIEEIGTFATMLTQADKFGTSIGESLRVFSDDLRYKRQIARRGARGQGPDQDAVPAGAVHLPVVIMVILAPAMIPIVRTILPMLGSGREAGHCGSLTPTAPASEMQPLLLVQPDEEAVQAGQAARALGPLDLVAQAQALLHR